MEKQIKKYEVQVIEKKGTCDDTLFEKMAKNGDLTAIKLAEILNVEVKITGYALCHIVTEDKEFDLNYFDTEEYGLISSGSEIFTNSVLDYYGQVENVRLTEIKTKKGTTYKAVPVLPKKNNKQQTTDEITKNDDELPF